MTRPAPVAGWSGARRTAAELVCDYDWDGAIGPVVVSLIAMAGSFVLFLRRAQTPAIAS